MWIPEEGYPTAGPAVRSNKRRGSGRGHPVSCPLSLGRAAGGFVSPDGGSEPIPARGSPSTPPLWDPERPRCLRAGLRAGSAGGRGPIPACSAAPVPVLPRRNSTGYRKSLPAEVPPSATSGPGAERGQFGRGGTGILRGPTGSGLTRASRGAGGGPGQGQRSWGGGVPAVSPAPFRTRASTPRPGAGTGSSELRCRPVPAAPCRSSSAMANHLRFVGRTVMVQNGNVDAAYGVLNR